MSPDGPEFYDITRPLVSGMEIWPGDAPFRLEHSARLSEGDTVNLCAVSLSTHSGSHADAPYHFEQGGRSIDQIPLEIYVGPAIVVDVSGRGVIGIQDLEGVDVSKTPRVLFKTGGWPDGSPFPRAIPTMSPELPGFLKEQGVRLVGLDVPSVDAIDSRDLPMHHALNAAGIHILESLDLSRVPAGCYELIALPLRLVGADASPVRAVLRALPGR
jgi:arylformamidase